MSATPSIRGSILAGHAEVLKKLLAGHAVDPAELARRFEPGELEILQGWIHPVGWYDIRLYTRLLEFLRDSDGEGSSDYLIAAGRRSASDMVRSGTYPEFQHLRNTELAGTTRPTDRFFAFGRDLRQLMTIADAMLNFAPNQLLIDPVHPDRYVIQHIDAEAYPEVLAWTSQGFCNRMAEEHGSPDLWYWERHRHDLVWFRMTRPV